MQPFYQALSEADLIELESFLAAPVLNETSLDLFSLDGYFTAVLSGPRIVMPSQWLPWVWDMKKGEVEPKFESIDAAQRKVGLLMGYYNMVALRWTEKPRLFEPVSRPDRLDEADSWRLGYLAGMRFDHEAWSELMVAQPRFFEPILNLGAGDGEMVGKGKRTAWTPEVARVVVRLHHYWHERRPPQKAGILFEQTTFGRHPDPPAGPAKVGRNDLCPCGSGKKYKRCCLLHPPRPAGGAA